MITDAIREVAVQVARVSGNEYEQNATLYFTYCTAPRLNSVLKSCESCIYITDARFVMPVVSLWVRSPRNGRCLSLREGDRKSVV